MTLRRLAGLLACAATAAAAGCGGAENERDPAPRAPSALEEAAKAARDQTLRVEVRRSGNVPGEGGYSFEGTGLVRNADASVKGAIGSPDGPLAAEVRVLGGETWLTVDDGVELPGGARWIHVERGRLTVETSIAPHFLLEVFERARDVERVPGGGKVKGAPTTHYRGGVPAAELEDLLFEVAAAGGDRKVSVDLHVADGLPKRLQMEHDAGQARMSVDVVVLGVARAQPAGPPPGPIAEYDDLG